MIATAPLMLLWFNRLPLSGIAANAIVAAIFPLYMCAAAPYSYFSEAPEFLPELSLLGLGHSVQAYNMAPAISGADAPNAISPAIYADTVCLCALSAAIVAAAVLVNSNNRYGNVWRRRALR